MTPRRYIRACMLCSCVIMSLEWKTMNHTWSRFLHLKFKLNEIPDNRRIFTFDSHLVERRQEFCIIQISISFHLRDRAIHMWNDKSILRITRRPHFHSHCHWWNFQMGFHFIASHISHARTLLWRFYFRIDKSAHWVQCGSHYAHPRRGFLLMFPFSNESDWMPTKFRWNDRIPILWI